MDNKKMTVTVFELDDTTTTYAFDPMETAQVIGFYTKSYWTSRIRGFKAILADGEILEIGAK
jgi:hypothetical protein